MGPHGVLRMPAYNLTLDSYLNSCHILEGTGGFVAHVSFMVFLVTVCQ